MRKAPLFALLLLLLPHMRCPGQGDTTFVYRNALKINTVSLVFSNASLYYERHLNENMTLLLGASHRWGGDLPKIIGLGEVVLTSGTTGVKGASVSSEFRYYLDQCDCSPNPTGLYFSAYARYTRYWGELGINIWDGSQYVDMGFIGELQEAGIGAQVGYQLILRERFLIDFMIAGPRISLNWASMKIGSEYAEELFPALEDELNRRLDALGIEPIEIPASGETDFFFDYRYFRYGISLGIMF